MKKMFSLLLVAVLVVGMLPFQAFAADCTHANHTKYNGGKNLAPTCTEAGYECHKCDDCGAYISVPLAATGHTPSAAASCTASQTCTVCGEELAAQLDHTPGAAATCSAPQTCTVCGEELNAIDASAHKAGPAATCSAPQTCTLCGEELNAIDATAHKAGPAATCTTAQTCTLCGTELVAALGHDIDEEQGHCTRCNPDGSPIQTARKAITWQVKNVEGGSVVNSGSFTPNGETAAAKDILYYHVFNKTTAWKDQYTVDKVWSSKQQADVGYNGSIAEGDTVTYVLTPKSGSSSGSGTGTGTTIPSGTSSLKVWARIFVGESLNKTILLDTISNLSADAKIYRVIAANKARLEGKFPTGYNNIDWADTVFYNISKDTIGIVNTEMTVGDEDDVFIDLWSTEKLVVVNVHTSKSYHVDLSVRVGGFRVGETVTYNDVLKAIQKYYNVSAMDMYTYDEMQKVILGKTGNKMSNYQVHSGDNVFDVLITGSRKSGSYTYTADSSNPKTGDAIFTPVIVMGASVTALAVLFFLNKKRAF